MAEALRRTSEGLRLLRRALRLVWQSARGWTIASIVLVVLQGLIPLASLYLVKLMFDTIGAAFVQPSDAALKAHIITLIILAGIVAMVQALVSALTTWVNAAQSQAVTDYVYDLIHLQSIALDLAYYENAGYYDKLHRAQREASFRPARIVNGLIQAAQSAVSLVAILALLVSIHWSVLPLLLMAAVPGVLIRLRFAGQTFRWLREHTSEERKAWYYNWMLTDGGHAKEIRLFDLGALFIERFRDFQAYLRGERNRIAARRALIEFVTGASMVLAVFLSFCIVVSQAWLGSITVGDLVMYFQAFQRAQNLLQTLLFNLVNLYEDGLFLSYLDEFLAQEPAIRDGNSPKDVPKPMQTGIAFENVNFQYPGSQHLTLQAIDLVLKPGETIALVGENGQGKTTLVKLLCRLYDPTAGRITLDGIDLRQFRVADLRQAISVIFQDYVHYNLTAAENIALGDVQKPADSAQVAAAAQQSGADSVIETLPEGYETVLGKLFQDGEELSIGQWQKIALARAFFRQAQVVILDEPTSALDAQAEYDVFQQFRQLMRGRSAILISHRMSTVKMADRIYVLKGGRIAESGTHDELMALKGEYATLFELQAQHYQ